MGLDEKLNEHAFGDVGFCREIYGNDKEKMPNDHCFWCPFRMAWIETDEHLRRRIKDKI